MLITVLTLAGTIVRFTVKDRTLSSSLIFYAAPLPVLLLGTLCCLMRSVWQRRRGVGLRWAILAGIIGITWLRQDWNLFSQARSGQMSDRLSHETDASEDIAVLFWNVARRQDLRAAARFIRKRAPDLVGLVEVQGDPEQWRRFWKNEFPDYDVTVLGANMYLLARGSSGQAIPHNLGGGSQARQLEVRMGQRLYEILLVDIHANPLQPRGQALRNLAKLADQLSDRRLVVMGDFNTPEDSVHLQSLRKRHLLAFEVAGSGYGPTWPVPLPLMQLDQIWTNFQVIPVECRHSWTWASDHEPVEAIIRPRRSVPE